MKSASRRVVIGNTIAGVKLQLTGDLGKKLNEEKISVEIKAVSPTRLCVDLYVQGAVLAPGNLHFPQF